MAKEKKWKYKFLSEEKFAEYQDMDEDTLVNTIKEQASYLDQCKKAKASSDYLKDIKKDIADFRKDWQKTNPEKVEEIEQLKAQIKDIQDERDKAIQDALDEKKDLEGGLNDAIKGANEHIEALLFCLRFHR